MSHFAAACVAGMVQANFLQDCSFCGYHSADKVQQVTYSHTFVCTFKTEPIPCASLYCTCVVHCFSRATLQMQEARRAKPICRFSLDMGELLLALMASKVVVVFVLAAIC